MTTPINSNVSSYTPTQSNSSSGFDTALAQTEGFMEGVSETVLDTVKGTVSLATDAAQVKYDLSIEGVVHDLGNEISGEQTSQSEPSYLRGLKSINSAAQTVRKIVQDPSVIVDAVVDPITQDWDQGNYGKAIGRGTAETMMLIAGPKGVNNYAKTGRISGSGLRSLRMHQYDVALSKLPGQVVFGKTITPAQREMITKADEIIAGDKYASILRNGLDQTGTKLAYDNIPVKDINGWFSPKTNTVVINMKDIHSVEDIINVVVHESQHVRRHNRGINQATQNAEYKALRVETIVDKSIAGSKKQSLGMRKVGWEFIKSDYADLPRGKSPFGTNK